MSTHTGRTGPLRIMAAVAVVLSFLLPGAVSVAQEVDCSEWASETLEIMAPASPGGGWDTTAREIQRVLQEEGIVENVEVFNVPGAGGTIGLAELVNEHAGNEHMLMMMGLVMVGGIVLNESPVDLTQVTPIARLTTEYEVIVVPADSEYQTIDELLTAFQEDPSSISWAGGSAGGTDHLLVGLLAEELGVDPAAINYVPFSGGGEALSAILGGETTAGVSGLGEWQAQIESGELRALAVSGRGAAAPGSATPTAGEATPAAFGANIPTLQEAGYDVELANWRGFVAPPDISEEAETCMIQALEQAVQSEAWQTTLETYGWNDFFLAGDAFGAYLQEEHERVTALLSDLGLTE
ncbi:MAG TPA: tripartite tricarboxylate transporter substrate-binding protein [Thermomicrobiales bacterium]|nr:tripartite tricarboxylate transporter substrate-binding protein [Thermomicrobiales bacterium]